MNPEVERYIIPGLWLLAILLIAWTWIPAALAAMGATSHQLIGPSGTADPSGLEPKTGEPEYDRWYRQLRELDFEPIGSGRVRLRNLGARWQVQSGLRFFQQRSQPIIAIVQQLPSPFNLWRVLHLATVLVDGTLVLTTTSGEDRLDEAEGLLMQSVKSDRLSDLLTIHAEALGSASKSGNRADSDRSLEAVLVAMDRALTPRVKAGSAKVGRQHLFVHSVIHLSVSTPMLQLMPITHWGLPLANAAMAIIMLMGESMTRKAAARDLQAAARVRAAGESSNAY